MLPIIVILAVFGVAISAPAGDECNPDVMDLCGKEIMFIGVDGQTIPNTKEALYKFCEKELVGEKCAKDYIKKCLKNLPRQLATVIVNSATKETQSWCEEGRDEEVVENVQCMSERQAPLDKCMQNVVAFFEEVEKSEDNDNKLPHACCTMASLRKCITETLEGCPEHSLEFLEEVIQSYASDALDLACAGYEEGSDRCKALPKIEVPANKNITSFTIFKPLVGLIGSL